MATPPYWLDRRRIFIVHFCSHCNRIMLLSSSRRELFTHDLSFFCASSSPSQSSGKASACLQRLHDMSSFVKDNELFFLLYTAQPSFTGQSILSFGGIDTKNKEAHYAFNLLQPCDNLVCISS